MTIEGGRPALAAPGPGPDFPPTHSAYTTTQAICQSVAWINSSHINFYCPRKRLGYSLPRVVISLEQSLTICFTC